MRSLGLTLGGQRNLFWWAEPLKDLGDRSLRLYGERSSGLVEVISDLYENEISILGWDPAQRSLEALEVVLAEGIAFGHLVPPGSNSVSTVVRNLSHWVMKAFRAARPSLLIR